VEEATPATEPKNPSWLSVRARGDQDTGATGRVDRGPGNLNWRLGERHRRKFSGGHPDAQRSAGKKIRTENSQLAHLREWNLESRKRTLSGSEKSEGWGSLRLRPKWIQYRKIRPRRPITAGRRKRNKSMCTTEPRKQRAIREENYSTAEKQIDSRAQITDRGSSKTHTKEIEWIFFLAAGTVTLTWDRADKREQHSETHQHRMEQSHSQERTKRDSALAAPNPMKNQQIKNGS
jgi:hypothetical protein